MSLQKISKKYFKNCMCNYLIFKKMKNTLIIDFDINL